MKPRARGSTHAPDRDGRAQWQQAPSVTTVQRWARSGGASPVLTRRAEHIALTEVGAPTADVTIDEGLVRGLLMAQHPELADRTLQRVAGGWDNEVWRLGHDVAVRLPRRRATVPLLRIEQRWLPRLAPSLPLPVPVPRHLGLPGDRFGWPWSLVPWIDGSAADRTPPGRPLDAAVVLGGFLRALHRPAPDDAPHNPWRSVPLRTRQHTFERRIAALASTGAASPATVGALRRRWAEAVDAPAWRGAPCWVHGDLHPANTVVRGGTVVGILDFGDLSGGDPATDLAAAWLLLPVAAQQAFWDAYGRDDGPLRRRAAGWATLFALLLHGSVGGPDAGRVAAAAIGRLAGSEPDASGPPERGGGS